MATIKNLDDLFENTCIHSISWTNKNNDQYISESKVFTQRNLDIRKEYHKLVDKFKDTNHVFRKHNTEITAIFTAIHNLQNKSSWLENIKKWDSYSYVDIYWFYSILWNNHLHQDIEKELNDIVVKKILSRFRETRNKFFDHRQWLSRLDHTWTATTNTQVYFYRYADNKSEEVNCMVILEPIRDFNVFLGILKKLPCINSSIEKNS